MASALYRLLANRIGLEYQQATAKKIFRNLLDVSATVEVLEHEVVVTLDKDYETKPERRRMTQAAISSQPR